MSLMREWVAKNWHICCGSISKTRKGLVMLTRKGLVSNVLVIRVSLCDYSRSVNDQKNFYACCFVHGAIDTWILILCWQSIYSIF